MEIKREFYLKQLIDAKNDQLIKIITGIRRCGKSYLLNTLFYNHLMENNVYLNDVIERNHLRSNNELDTLIQIVSSNIGSLTNPKKISDTF